MRKLFGHVLPPTEAEFDAIWNQGILTVDANVLLDLYRYHPETRDALVQALRDFRGSLWLSYQAASEFVRNRAGAAAAVANELTEAEQDLRILESAAKTAAESLRGRRPLPRDVGQRLKADVDAAIRAARESTVRLRAQHEEGSATDSILSDVLSLFDGRIGVAPEEAELSELHKEAERRITEKVPPGYEDAKKGGAKAYGDYLLWHQVLQHAKLTGKPVILVTSERKEDWWERHNGRTLGPRLELLEEAHKVSGQRVLIYRTDSFIERALAPAQGWLAAWVLGDIRREQLDEATEVVQLEFDELMYDLVRTLGNEVLATDVLMRRLVAETKFDDWEVSDADVEPADVVDSAGPKLTFTARIYYDRPSHKSGPPVGLTIRADLRGTIERKDGAWLITDHKVEDAEIDHDED